MSDELAARQRKPWRAEEDAVIVRLRADGHECNQIAHALNRSLSSAKSRIDLLVERGVVAPSRRPWMQSDDARVICMREAGASTREIAIATGRSLSSTTQHVHKLLDRGALRRLSDAEAKTRWHRQRDQQSTRLAEAARSLVTSIAPTKRAGYAIGVLFGDGSILKDGRSITLKCTNASFADAFAHALHTTFGQAPRRLERTEPEKHVGGRVYRNTRYYEVMLHRRHIAHALLEWIGPTSTWDWAINVEDALSRGPEFCDGVIQGLFDSDGSFSLQGVSGIQIRMGTASEGGARSLHELMTRRGYGVGFGARSTGNEYRVTVRAASCVRYASEISSRIDYKRQRLEAFLARRSCPSPPATSS